MKRIISGILAIAMCLLSLLALTYCAPKDKPLTLSAGQMVNGILKVGGYASPDCLAVKGDGVWERQFDAYYGISPDLVSDGALAYASGLSADEISCLVAKDAKDVATLEKALTDHVDREYQNYVKYDAHEASKLKSAKTVTYGRYVFLIVSDDVSEMLETLKKLVKDPATVPAYTPVTDTGSDQPTETETTVSGYDYSKPVPENKKAELAAWEAGTLFIGDSRLYGLTYYLGLDLYRSYAFESLSINGIETKKLVKGDGGDITIAEAVKKNNGFTRCYLMFGINELSWANSESFRNYYRALIDTVRAANPDAEIYLMAVYPVEEAAVKNYKDVFTNANIRALNKTLLDLAEEKQVYYLDSFAALEENGGLPSGSTNDGIHVGKGLCRQFLNYILSHTVKH